MYIQKNSPINSPKFSYKSPTQEEDIAGNLVEVETKIVEETEWREHNEKEFQYLSNLLTNKVKRDDIDWSKLDFNIYNKEFYKKKHPKFSDEVCEILADCSKKKAHDERCLPLKIEKGNFKVSFD